MTDTPDGLPALATAEALPAHAELRHAAEVLTAPDAKQYFTDEIVGVPGIARVTTAVQRRIEGQQAPLTIGGARIAPAERLVATLRNTDPEYVLRMTGYDPRQQPDESDEAWEARERVVAAMLEARELADEMTFKWIAYYKIMQQIPEFYAEMAALGITNWMDTALLVGGHKTVIEANDMHAFKALERDSDERRLFIAQLVAHINRVNTVAGIPFDPTVRCGMQFAPDMNTNTALMNEVGELTPNVVCTSPDSQREGCGDPSTYTAEGVFQGILGTLDALHEDGNDMRFFVQGALGAVGRELLIRHLLVHFPKAEFVLCDLDERRAELDNLAAAFEGQRNIRVVSQAEFYTFRNGRDGEERKGLLSLNAGPGELTHARIHDLLDMGVVAEAGAANYLYPSGDEATPEEYMAMGILVAPPYLINPGGIAATITELVAAFGGKRPTDEQLRRSLAGIRVMIRRILQEAMDSPDHVSADKLARRMVYGEFARRLAEAA